MVDLMSDTLPPFDESGLSVEDRGILQKFLARESWVEAPSSGPLADKLIMQQDDDLLSLFHAEATDDIALLRSALQQVMQDESSQLARLNALMRPAHKIRGTAGAVGKDTLSELAHIIEIIVQQTQNMLITPQIALSTLQKVIDAMAALLTQENQPDEEFLLVVLEELERVGIDLVRPSTSIQPVLPGITATDEPNAEPMEQEAVLRVEAQRIERLALHVEVLAELSAPLESAEQQVEQALQELQSAQARVQYLEETLMALSLLPKTVYDNHHNHPTSSLIARILTEASEQQNAPRRLKVRPRLVKAAGATPWTEQEQEQVQERESLMRSLHEAIADVTLAIARVRSAFLHLRMQTRHYTTQSDNLRGDILALRAAPFRSLIALLRQEIESSILAQAQAVHFEVTGEATEIDQDILEDLKKPLSQLVRTCLTDALLMQPTTTSEPHTIWLRVQGIDSEAIIEIGFSMMVQGGAIDAVRPAIQQLNGMISSQRNASGGISILIRLPRSRGAVRCLLVRVGGQQLLVPFVQVQRISEEKAEECDILYTMRELLDIPTQSAPLRIQPVLILVQHTSRLMVGVVVDEVVQELELLVRPLAPYLQRPGITGTAIDGKGHVLLMVDLPGLLRHNTTLQRKTRRTPGIKLHPQQSEGQQPLILIADDSISMRQALQTILGQENYKITEAQEGVEALMRLLEQPPDIFILDMDMPNMNGFDLLGIIQLYPELSNVKIIMLTSHDNERDRQHALELGAHAYLIKPTNSPELLQTIQNLLA